MYSRLRSCLATALLLTVCSSATGQENWPPPVTNLQFYPKEIPFGDLMSSMRGFTSALGVRCRHCHVGEEGAHLSEYDYASDQKPAKQHARLMLKMTRAINAEHLPGLEMSGERLEVECVTCHRGLTRPEQLDRLLVREAADNGYAVALELYENLRSEHFGSHSYDFGERTLIAAGRALADLEDFDGAIAFHERNLELFPESKWTLGTLARTRLAAGDRDGAIAVLEQLIELDPENSRARDQLERLKSPPAEDHGEASASN